MLGASHNNVILIRGPEQRVKYAEFNKDSWTRTKGKICRI